MENENSYNKEECRKYLSTNLAIFSPDEMKLILELIETVKFKRQVNISNSFIDKNICIIGKGVVRHYSNMEKIGEQTLRFTFIGELLHHYGDPGEQLQTISECVIYTISYETLKQISDCRNKLKKCINISTLKKLSFEINLLRVTPEERYKFLLKKGRDIFLNVPAKFIASYWGITPQALCRIRKRHLSIE